MSVRSKILSRPKIWASAALVTSGLAGGAVIGSALSATAASTTTPSSIGSTSAPSGSGSNSADHGLAMPAHGSAAHEQAETPVTGSVAAQAQSAAVKYVGSGTAGSVTTDCTKQGYEVTVTKADGSQVEVHEDGSFNVVRGGPGGGPDGGRGGPPHPGNSSGTGVSA